MDCGSGAGVLPPPKTNPSSLTKSPKNGPGPTTTVSVTGTVIFVVPAVNMMLPVYVPASSVWAFTATAMSWGVPQQPYGALTWSQLPPAGVTTSELIDQPTLEPVVLVTVNHCCSGLGPPTGIVKYSGFIWVNCDVCAGAEFTHATNANMNAEQALVLISHPRNLNRIARIQAYRAKVSWGARLRSPSALTAWAEAWERWPKNSRS